MQSTTETNGTAADTNNSHATAAATIQKLSQQLKKTTEAHKKASEANKKLVDANARLKQLLNMAKERIEKQDLQSQQQSAASTPTSTATTPADSNSLPEGSTTVTRRVCQLVHTTDPVDQQPALWVLLEQYVLNELTNTTQPPFHTWRSFRTLTECEDALLRQHTGEPLTLPSASLTPEQSDLVRQEAQQQVAKITEDYRRFRVKTELHRQSLERQVQELQQQNILQQQQSMSASANTESQEAGGSGGSINSASATIQQLRAQLAATDAQWQESYNVLLQENQVLKSSGSEALLASQWRQRYEHCVKEKEELESRLQSRVNDGDNSDATYEAKYRDLKESFRVYRKKAKEMFDQTQAQAPHTGDGSGGGTPSIPPALLASPAALSATATAEARLSYLKNLLFHYLTAEPAMRDHMQSAIGMVLQFTPSELQEIDKIKQAREAWFYA